MKPHETCHHDNLWKCEGYILFCGEARRQANVRSPSKPILNEGKWAVYERTAAVG